MFVLHQRDHFEQRLVRRAEPCDERHPLLSARVAHVFDDELLGDLRDARGAHPCGDQVQHHVERRDAARAGDAIAVDDEQLLQEARVRELLLQRRHVLPVDRARVAREQPRLRERIGARAQAAERDARARETAQRRQMVGRGRALHVDAAAHEDDIGQPDAIGRPVSTVSPLLAVTGPPSGLITDQR